MIGSCVSVLEMSITEIPSKLNQLMNIITENIIKCGQSGGSPSHQPTGTKSYAPSKGVGSGFQ